MKKKLIILTMFILLCLLTACSGTSGQKKQMELPEGAMWIFYVSSETSTLESEAYIPEQTEPEKLVKELFERLKQQPAELGDACAVPEDVELLECVLDGEQLTLYFGESYYQMDSITEVLCRAAIVKTLMQLEEIDGIEFMVNNQPLVDKSGHTGHHNVKDSNVKVTAVLFVFLQTCLTAVCFYNFIASTAQIDYDKVADCGFVFANKNFFHNITSVSRSTYFRNRHLPVFICFIGVLPRFGLIKLQRKPL